MKDSLSRNVFDRRPFLNWHMQPNAIRPAWMLDCVWLEHQFFNFVEKLQGQWDRILVWILICLKWIWMYVHMLCCHKELYCFSNFHKVCGLWLCYECLHIHRMDLLVWLFSKTTCNRNGKAGAIPGCRRRDNLRIMAEHHGYQMGTASPRFTTSYSSGQQWKQSCSTGTQSPAAKYERLILARISHFHWLPEQCILRIHVCFVTKHVLLFHSPTAYYTSACLWCYMCFAIR